MTLEAETPQGGAPPTEAKASAFSDSIEWTQYVLEDSSTYGRPARMPTESIVVGCKGQADSLPLMRAHAREGWDDGGWLGAIPEYSAALEAKSGIDNCLTGVYHVPILDR